jgi:N-acetylmuramoyl-L-alanine amidase
VETQKNTKMCRILSVCIGVTLFAGCTVTPEGLDVATVVPVADQLSGALDGIKTAVSPGQGLQPSIADPGTYEYQRAMVNGILEDVFTQDFCIYYLYPALERCGASVTPLRQRDRTTIGVSGQAAWLESSLMYLTSINALSASIAGVNDVTVRPYYSIEQEVDCLVSVHVSNSGMGGALRGTEVDVWNQEAYPVAADESVLPPGTMAFAQALYSRCLEGARSISSDWAGRGLYGGNLGELRPIVEQYDDDGTNIPAALIELGYIDNANDAVGLSNSEMLAGMARGMLKGIIDGMGESADGYPPPRPVSVQGLLIQGGIRLTWSVGIDADDPVASATDSFVVKLSLNGEAWKNIALLPAGTNSIDLIISGSGTADVKIAARNDAGESLDSSTVTVAY